jgi:hypothetical protein
MLDATPKKRATTETRATTTARRKKNSAAKLMLGHDDGHERTALRGQTRLQRSGQATG